MRCHTSFWFAALISEVVKPRRCCIRKIASNTRLRCAIKSFHNTRIGFIGKSRGVVDAMFLQHILQRMAVELQAFVGLRSTRFCEVLGLLSVNTPFSTFTSVYVLTSGTPHNHFENTSVTVNKIRMTACADWQHCLLALLSTHDVTILEMVMLPV